MQSQVDSIIKGLQSFFQSTGRTKAVIGLSGGVDSALVAKLGVDALGKENITGLILPNHELTNPQNITDAQNWADELGVKNHLIPINPFLNQYKNLPWESSKLANINIQARARMTILYHYANTHDCIVLGTGNKTELLLGYFTKYGDGGVDVLPIGNLFKTEVWEMGKHLGLPKEILEKAPSAELTEAQTDEGEIGMTYSEMDKILIGFQNGKGAETEAEKKLHARMLQHSHKLDIAPIINT